MIKPAARNQRDPVRIERDQVQVVQAEHHGQPAVVGQPPREAQHRTLVAQVQVRGRLVHQDRRGLPPQRVGDEHTLPLAA